MPYPHPPIPESENLRLEEVHALHMLDTPPEEPFDGIAEVAAALFDVPYVAVTLIEAERQWFKANVGIPFSSNTRELAFCSHTIALGKTLVVDDFTPDARFRDHPYVAGDPELRFYAGTPLVTDRCQCVGTICVLDVKPRTFSPAQCRLLERLAHQATEAFEYRRLVDVIAGCLETTL